MTTDERAVGERDAAGRDPGEPDVAGQRPNESEAAGLGPTDPDEGHIDRLFGSLPTVRVSRLTDEE